MHTQDYLALLQKKMTLNYDLYPEHHINQQKFDLYAHFYARNERYVATKSATLYAFENNEHCFFKSFDQVSLDSLDEFIHTLKSMIPHLINPHSDHMSSAITGVIISERTPEPALIHLVESFKYQKSFLLGLKGWVDVRIILVDLDGQRVISSKKAKKIEKYYLPS